MAASRWGPPAEPKNVRDAQINEPSYRFVSLDSAQPETPVKIRQKTKARPPVADGRFLCVIAGNRRLFLSSFRKIHSHREKVASTVADCWLTDSGPLIGYDDTQARGGNTTG